MYNAISLEVAQYKYKLVLFTRYSVGSTVGLAEMLLDDFKCQQRKLGRMSAVIERLTCSLTHNSTPK